MKLTSVLKPADVQRDWVLIDADGKTFGRILTEVATLLSQELNLKIKSTLLTVVTSVLLKVKNLVIC